MGTQQGVAGWNGDAPHSKAFAGPAIPFSALPGAAPTSPAGFHRSTFRDPGHDAAIDSEGFAVVPFADRRLLDDLRDAVERHGPAPDDPRDGFFPGNASRDIDWKRGLLRDVLPMVSERLDALFDRHHAYHLTVLTKWPGDGGWVPAHQDPTMVRDEGRYRGVTLWCPLDGHVPEEVDPGVLRVVPRSHRLRSGDWYRARGVVRSAVEQVEREVYEEFGRAVDTTVGEAVVFDHRLVHYSHHNQTDHPRRVLAVALRPVETTNVHIEQRGDGWVDVFGVDDEYFVSDPPVGGLGDERRIARLRSCDFEPIDVPDLRRLDGDDPGPTPDVAPTPTSAPVAPVPPRRVVRLARDAVTRTRGAMDLLAAIRPGWGLSPSPGIFRDARADRRLGRDGFATFRLLSDGEADRLRDDFGRMNGWEGDGFRTDAWHADPEYRRAASAALADGTEAALATQFVDHTTIIRNFVAKWPQREPDETFPQAAHRDWTFTDESRGVRSWVVWVALDDIDHDNGQLRVARGSHRLDRMVRGINLEAAWRLHRDVWEPRLLSVPLRRGEAIVIDSSLVHCSFPNLTDDLRLAAAIVITTREASLVCYRRADDRRAHRYDITPEFLTDHRLDQLQAAPPDLPIAGVVDIGAIDLTPGQLARRLDLQPLSALDRLRARAARPTTPPNPPSSPPTADPAPAAIDPGVWDPGSFGWTAAFEANWRTIREEYRTLAEGRPIPLIADAVGVDQGNHGVWRTFLFLDDDGLIPEHRALCPRTAELIAGVPGLRSAGFSVLEPGAHIPVHRGPDDDVLRYHLGVIVPGPIGASRLRVGTTDLAWAEGESLMFDDAARHEAWNDGPDDRVVLIIEVDRPAVRP